MKRAQMYSPLARIFALLLCFALLAPSLPPAQAAFGDYPDLGNAVGVYESYNPQTGGWTTGATKGYNESHTVVLRIGYTLTAGNQREVVVCGDYRYKGTGAYAYINLKPFNTTFSPPGVPGTLYWDASNNVAATSATVDYVGLLAKGAAPCSTNEIGYYIGFTALTTGSGHIYVGLQLASPGLATAYGDVVGAGQGVSAWPTGTFQTYLQKVAGNRTVSSQPGDVLPPSANLAVTVDCSINWTGSGPYFYTATAINNGPGTATQPVLTFSVDNTLNYSSSTSEVVINGVTYPYPTCTWNPVTRVATCAMTSSLPPTTVDSTAKWIVKVYVTVANPGAQTTASVTVSSNTADPDSSDNTYYCTTTTPVTVSYFQATREGDRVRFVWSTASETGNRGFNLFSESEGVMHRITDTPIASRSGDSVSRQDYEYSADGVVGETFYIQDVDAVGRVRWHGPYLAGKEYGVRLPSEEADWSAVRAEHESKAAASLAAAQAVQAMNLLVDRNGIYRVTYQELRDAGLNLAGVPASAIAVLNKGVPVSIRVGGGTVFGPGSFVEFYGEAVQSLYTRTNVYTLKVDATAARRITIDRTPPPTGIAPVPFYMETATVADNKAYAYYSPDSDPWYLAELLAFTRPLERSFDITVDHYVAGAAASTLTVKLWGATDWPAAPDHHVLLSFNGTQVADDIFDGLTVRTLTANLGTNGLREGTNTVTLTLPGDTGVEWDGVRLDRYSVTYPRAFVARSGRLGFTAAGSLLQVNGFPTRDIVVYRLTGRTPVLLAGAQATGTPGNFSIRFPGAATSARYLVSNIKALLKPTLAPARPVTNITSGSARYLIISHSDFIAGLAPLVQARQAQGLTVRVVDVADVYAQFSYGIVDPAAIRAYIQKAVRDMGTQYVLLVGGDTYDYFDYRGLGSISFIPTLYARTSEYVYFAPVDALFADTNGDNVPDVALGRFPVRTSAELQAMIAKTLAYEGKAYGGTAVFSADSAEGPLSYAAQSETAINLLPAGWQVERAYLDTAGVAAARTALIGAINQGTALTSYTGHGDPLHWSFSGLFTASDAAALTNNGKPTIVMQYGCWNAYHVQPSYTTLAHKLLLSGTQGAAAVLGASAISTESAEYALAKLVAARIAQPGMTIGRAVLLAKQQLAAQQPGLADVQLGWTLLGDPALVVQR